MAGEFSAGAGGLLGTNDLQQSIDTFKSAVDDLKSTVSSMATAMGGGMLRHPAMGMMGEGQTFTRGSLDEMASGGNGAMGLASSQQRGGIILGQGLGGSGSSSQPPTMGSMAAGGGANGGGATSAARVAAADLVALQARVARVARVAGVLGVLGVLGVAPLPSARRLSGRPGRSAAGCVRRA